LNIRSRPISIRNRTGKDQLFNQYVRAPEAAIKIEKKMSMPDAAGILKTFVSWNRPTIARNKNVSMIEITAVK
jgi:hypothetical protein